MVLSALPDAMYFPSGLKATLVIVASVVSSGSPNGVRDPSPPIAQIWMNPSSLPEAINWLSLLKARLLIGLKYTFVFSNNGLPPLLMFHNVGTLRSPADARNLPSDVKTRLRISL